MKKILSLLLVVWITKFSYGYINIYPTEFNKNIENGVTETFKLYNRTERTVRYRIYIESSGDKNDMSKWIEIYPQSILLNSLDEKEIRVAVTPPKNISSGEYKAKLVVKEVEVPNYKKDKSVKFMTIFKLKMKGYILENDINRKRKE